MTNCRHCNNVINEPVANGINPIDTYKKSYFYFPTPEILKIQP